MEVQRKMDVSLGFIYGEGEGGGGGGVGARCPVHRCLFLGALDFKFCFTY